jgi:hypothetical protein
VITKFDSPRLEFAPDAAGNVGELGMSARRLVITMATVTGNIWMLENVDR